MISFANYPAGPGPAVGPVRGGDALDADAVAFAASVGATDVARLSRLFRALKGQGLYENLIACWPMRSGCNAGSGLTVHDVTNTHDLTIAGSMAWGASGFTFDGVNDRLGASGAVLPTSASQCAALFFFRKTATTAATIEYIFAQWFTGAPNGRLTCYYSAVDDITVFKRVDPTSYVLTSGSMELLSHTRSLLVNQTGSNFALHLDGNPNPVDSEALAPAAHANTPFTVGANSAGATAAEHFAGQISLGMVFGTSLTAANYQTLQGLLIDDWAL